MLVSRLYFPQPLREWKQLLLESDRTAEWIDAEPPRTRESHTEALTAKNNGAGETGI